jgi:HSP20 family protein
MQSTKERGINIFVQSVEDLPTQSTIKENLNMTIYISPYRRLSNLREAMNRVFEEAYPDEGTQEREMTLAVDVIGEEDAYIIKALVPGIETDDLNIDILNNTVSIRGEFKADQEEGANFLTSELPEGRFSRIITLPVAVDASKAEATLKNGVLTLRIPKAEAHRPKSIKVNLG